MKNIRLPEKGDILILKDANGNDSTERFITREAFVKIITDKGLYDIDSFDLSTTATTETVVAVKSARKKKNNVSAVLMLIIFGLLALLCVTGVYILDNAHTMHGLIAIIDTPINVSTIPYAYDELTVPITDPTIDKLNEKLEMDKMCINMNSSLDFATCDATSYFGIKNDTRNNYPQFVTITLDSNDIQIYQTDLIEVGDCILYDTLDVKLPKGTHFCTATFTQVNTETNTVCGHASAKITIKINN